MRHYLEHGSYWLSVDTETTYPIRKPYIHFFSPDEILWHLEGIMSPYTFWQCGTIWSFPDSYYGSLNWTELLTEAGEHPWNPILKTCKIWFAVLETHVWQSLRVGLLPCVFMGLLPLPWRHTKNHIINLMLDCVKWLRKHWIVIRIIELRWEFQREMISTLTPAFWALKFYRFELELDQKRGPVQISGIW